MRCSDCVLAFALMLAYFRYLVACRGKKKVQEQSNLIKEDEEPTLLMAVINEDVKDEEILLNEKEIEPKLCTNSNNTFWYLDNGASNHMTGNHEHFKEIDENVTGQVRFGDSSYVKIKGKRFNSTRM
ncbi:hypothetical protein E3N88_38339 [Mikania micrantha]|uniref:Retrovirus-related Pol polyprotein from transposon TNT 1-94-like beta-barrel domain-containing protein n=1 Tax=Mikania micrantha TaxID=192012 RepID=A0A5N6LW85_9ASTR|nr:hypothetical protein E3N88_38339 [Mikania micrantha]